MLYNIQDGWGYMFTLHLPYSEWTKKRININKKLMHFFSPSFLHVRHLPHISKLRPRLHGLDFVQM